MTRSTVSLLLVLPLLACACGSDPDGDATLVGRGASPVPTEGDAAGELAHVAGTTERPIAGAADASSSEDDPAATQVPRCRVFGRVVGVDGRPVEGLRAVMSVYGTAWRKGIDVGTVVVFGQESPGVETRTGPDGSFELRAPLTDATRMEFRIDGSPYHGLVRQSYGDSGTPPRPMFVEGDNDLGELVVPDTGALAGTVVDEDGEPLEGVIVRTDLSATRLQSSSTRTDADGRYTLGHLLPGDLTLAFSGRSHVEVNGIGASVVAGETRPGPDVTLETAPILAGVVVGPDGEPASDVRFTAWTVRGGRGVNVRTDADGTFTAALPAPGTYSVEFRGDDRFRPWGGRSESSATFEAGATDVRIQLVATARRTLRVVDAASRAPLDSFQLVVQHARDGWPARERTIEGGEIEIGVVPGQTFLSISAPGYVARQHQVALPEDESVVVDPIEIELTVGFSVTGRIVAAGEPVANALVKLGPQLIPKVPGAEIDPFDIFGESYTVGAEGPGALPEPVRTDGGGAFRFDGLPVGSYSLDAEGDGGAPTKVEPIEVGQQPATDLGDVELAREARVEGRILLGGGRSPGGLRVRVGFGFFEDEHRVGADGSFSYGGLAPGEHELHVEPDGVRVVERLARSFEVAAGATARVDIDLSDSIPAAVTVRVRDHAQPLEGVAVALQQVEPAPDPNGFVTTGSPVTTDAEGRITLAAIVGRTYVAVVSDRGVELGRGPRFECAGERIHDVDLETGRLVVGLPPGLTVPKTATVELWMLAERDLDGGSSSSFVVRFSQAAAGEATRAAGHTWSGRELELERAPTGSFRVDVSASAMVDGEWVDVIRRQGEDVVVVAGETTRIDLDP